MLSDYLTDEMIVRMLIKQRCKIADQRAKQMQIVDFVGQTKHVSLNEEKEELCKLFPPRSKWCKVGGKRRMDMDSVQRNTFMLYATYCKAKSGESKEFWFQSLQKRIAHIRYLALHPGIALKKPTVQMLYKKDKKPNSVICRPVCKFDMDTKIVLSIYNKFLTNVLDNEFLEYSYAFRKPSSGNQFQHLDAVKELIKFRKEHLDEILYVSECDMQKFYDTLDHNIVKARFVMLMSKVKAKKISHADYSCAKQWFFNYIDCFDYYTDVFSYNLKKDDGVWEYIRNRYKGKEYEVEWVKVLEKEKKAKPYKRKGIPQGGALSGLIANIMMHYVDLSIHDVIVGKDVAYLRFCDDMILVTADEKLASEVLDIYILRLESSRLHPHPIKSMNIQRMKDFWDGKSRGPYKWGEHGRDIFPWITFVGFDINWRGEVRVRKKSYQKQLTKQHSVVWDLLNQYDKGKTPRYCMNTILESLRNRLIGMSVGRVTLWNYHDYKNVHCWLAAFPLLDKNKWAVAQLKGLDRHREKELYEAEKVLKKFNCVNRSKNMDGVRRKEHYYGKAYSYYGQAYKD